MNNIQFIKIFYINMAILITAIVITLSALCVLHIYNNIISLEFNGQYYKNNQCSYK